MYRMLHQVCHDQPVILNMIERPQWDLQSGVLGETRWQSQSKPTPDRVVGGLALPTDPQRSPLVSDEILEMGQGTALL